jgi:NhaD family Na+/H+ antiporter
METIIIVIFALGYLGIAFEHPLKINKAPVALLTGILCWVVLFVYGNQPAEETTELSHHFAKIAEILFFLLGAMTIVELVDSHQGFKVITNRITTTDTRKLLWIISLVTFFLSAVLDNLTTSIVIISLLRRLIHDDTQRKFFAGMVIIAANAGGAWSPIGDVTTTMLWIGGQVTAVNIVKELFIPSLVCLVVPLIYLSFKLKGQIQQNEYNREQAFKEEDVKGSKLMFFVGVGALLFVPIFKTITHMPPYMGMLLGLGVIWIVSELIHSDKDEEQKKPYTAIHALSKIDTSSILFFLGILVAISAMESSGILTAFASSMNTWIGNQDLIVIAIGLISAVIDNVPLVAASMGMYDLTTYLPDSKIWEMMAYCAGTGGSVLIIGSAAGVAVMGMEKIDFIWYLKKFSLLAMLGYFSGVIAYLLIFHFM